MKIGTCGMPVAWSRYVEKFSVVEIQKSFYSEIREETARRWRERVPEKFEFVLKAPQTITHEINSPTYRRYKGLMGNFGRFKVNEDTMRSWEEFMKIAKILKSRIIIFQSPPSFSESRENVENINNFFSTIEREFIYGWEPRGKWDSGTIRQICEKLNVIHVVDPFKSKKLYGEFGYYRLHGLTGYNYKFTDEELLKLRKIAKKEDYVMFNNTHMWEDALRFMEILERED